ncbi:hypothetical protein AAWM_00207 [Aspergillus awamori]|uniref:Uncharacterized protein n=1 Tax=Aspergillus awamori TaxID=105351 RepID=A0A401KDK8_ASPAW|nr:hypothetical protein AAWM_00207 [Aspergillus awamori]
MDSAQRASPSRLEYEDSETESFSNAYYSSDEYLDLIIDWNWTLSTKKLDTMSTLSGQTTSMEDDYIRHLLDLEEREAYWREREEKLKKELEATQAYLRHIREELGELEGVTDEDEDEDN